MLTHDRSGLMPYRQQDALALVIAGSVGMGFAEITERDRSVHGRDDLGQPDLIG